MSDEDLRKDPAQDEVDLRRDVALVIDKVSALEVPLVGRHGKHDRQGGRRVPEARARDDKPVDAQLAAEEVAAHPVNQVPREGAAQEQVRQSLDIVGGVQPPIGGVDPCAHRSPRLLVEFRVLAQR
eukprot:9886979-Heterocapsa_arctica.AAC.1